MATRLLRLERLERLPLDSSQPVVWFAFIRLLMPVVVLASLIVISFPFAGRLAGVVALVALPWGVGLLILARRSPALALHPLVAIGDFLVLVAVEAVVPETYGAARFVALFLVAAHAHFQGERMGLAIAGTGVFALVLTGALSDDPLQGNLLEFYELLFVVSALAMAFIIGGLRTAESAGRIRAREVTRRTFAAEDAVRRRLAVSIHDGPVQELVSLEMILTAARRARERGDDERLGELLRDAEGLATRNVHALRDEILSLGPHAYQELSFEMAVEEALPVWQRRYGVPIELDCERLDLGSELEGALFRIAQEAVANAGRHAGATQIGVRLHKANGRVELAIADDGRGFRDVGMLRRSEPGHLGIASMRERAEAVGGRLEIATGQNGTTVRVIAPAQDLT
jgi:signal transduction histidine kinase